MGDILDSAPTVKEGLSQSTKISVPTAVNKEDLSRQSTKNFLYIFRVFMCTLSEKCSALDGKKRFLFKRLFKTMSRPAFPT